MKLSHNGISIYYDFADRGSRHVLVLIHGFGGSSADWELFTAALPADQSYILIDLPGCGQSEKGSDDSFYTFGGLGDVVASVVGACGVKSAVLCGYSAGGRLVYYITAHRLIDSQTAFVAISTTPGIPVEANREERRLGDIDHAAMISEYGIEAWAENWLKLDLFEGLKQMPEDFMVEYRKRRVQNDPEVLQKYLLYSGTGVMEPQQPLLRELEMPGLLISGSCDEKYLGIASRVTRVNKLYKHVVIEGGWHTLYIEKPAETVKLIIDFLEELN